MKTKLLLLGFCSLLLLAALGGTAGALELEKWVVAGGGGTLEAGGLALHGTAGQAVVGRSSAGSFTLSHGFWPMEPIVIQREVFLPLVVR